MSEFETVVIETHKDVVDEGQRNAVVHSTYAVIWTGELGGGKRFIEMVVFFDMSESNEKVENVCAICGHCCC